MRKAMPSIWIVALYLMPFPFARALGFSCVPFLRPCRPLPVFHARAVPFVLAQLALVYQPP